MRRETRSATAVIAAPSRWRAVEHDGVALALGAVVEEVEESADEARVAPARGEVGPAVGEEARVGPAEGLHRNVGVTDEDDPWTPAGDDAQQSRRGRRQLLRLVDDDEPDALVQPGECGRVVVEQLGDGREHPRGVVGAVPAERGDLVVLAQHLRRGDPLGPVVLGAEPGEVVGPVPELDGAHQQVAQLVAEAAGRQRLAEPVGPLRRRHLTGGVPGEQVAQDDVLLRAVEQTRWRVAAQRRLGAQHAEAERLPGARQRLGRRAAEARGDLLAQRRPLRCGSTSATRHESARRPCRRTASTTSSTARVDLPLPGPAEHAQHPRASSRGRPAAARRAAPAPGRGQELDGG